MDCRVHTNKYFPLYDRKIWFSERRNCLWADQPDGYRLEQKVKWIKNNGLWEDVWDLYLDKKNYNENPDKKSRALYAETINEIAQKNGYQGKS